MSGCTPGVVPGCMVPNIYVTSLAGQGIADITGLQVGGANGKRAIRAKFGLLCIGTHSSVILPSLLSVFSMVSSPALLSHDVKVPQR